MKLSIITICFVLLLSGINMTSGENLPKIEKTSLVTLLDHGTIKIETIYRFEPGFDTFVTSEAIKSSENLKNVRIEINGKKVSKENYEEYFLLGETYRYIALKKSLFAYADINRINEVYMRYETKLSTDPQIKVDLLEICQRTDPQVDVSYTLITQSFDSSYLPRVISNQEEFIVTHYTEGFTILSRVYKSFNMSEEKKGMPIKGFFYINVSSRPLLGSTRTYKVIDPNLVKEIYNYKEVGIKELPPKHISVYPLSEYVELTKHPEIIIEIDGNKCPVNLIEYDDLKKICETEKSIDPSQCFYYIGKGLNSNENTLYIVYILNEGSTADVTIEIEYDASKILTSEDGFNYIFGYDLTSPAHVSKIKEFLIFEVPENFNIDDTNYKSNLITTNFKDSNNLRFKFENVLDFKSESLKIEFSREETKFLNFIKIVNIMLLCGIIFLSLLWLFHAIPFQIKYLSYIFLIVGVIINLIIGKLSSTNFFEAINYTYSWIPIALGILGFIIQIFYKNIK